MIQLKTNRLTIRNFHKEDWADLYEYFSDPKVLEFEPYEPFSKEKAVEEANRRENDQRFLAVCLADKIIGNIYFAKEEFGTWEVGYVFNRNYWGQGYATEAVRAVLKHAFHTLEAHRVIAMCDPLNPGSWKLLERLKMRREGHLIKNVYFKLDQNQNPIWKDTYLYAILKSDFSEE